MSSLTLRSRKDFERDMSGSQGWTEELGSSFEQ